jgi:hypothetical protein
LCGAHDRSWFLSSTGSELGFSGSRPLQGLYPRHLVYESVRSTGPIFSAFGWNR